MRSDWFTADLHLGHRRILDYTHRPFTSIPEMDEGLIERWNGVVKPTDTVWVLGDFTFHPMARALPIFHRLNGTKHLIEGNHDNRKGRQGLPWASSAKMAEWKHPNGLLGSPRLVMCHYPLLTWRNAHHGMWMLHGHCHNNLRAPETTRMDVGVDCHPEFRPFHLDEIVAILSQRTYHFLDHHQEG